MQFPEFGQSTLLSGKIESRVKRSPKALMQSSNGGKLSTPQIWICFSCFEASYISSSNTLGINTYTKASIKTVHLFVLIESVNLSYGIRKFRHDNNLLWFLNEYQSRDFFISPPLKRSDLSLLSFLLSYANWNGLREFFSAIPWRPICFSSDIHYQRK